MFYVAPAQGDHEGKYAVLNGCGSACYSVAYHDTEEAAANEAASLNHGHSVDIEEDEPPVEMTRLLELLH